MGRRDSARAVAGFVPDCVVLFSRLLRSERVPLRSKLLLAALLPYLLSPIDLVPDFLPVVGHVDDAVLVAFALRRVSRGNAELVRELWPGPRASLDVLLRLVGERR